MVGVEKGYQHFKLLGADCISQEAQGFADAALNGSQHLQWIAQQIQLAFSQLIGVEDEVCWLGAVWEDELRALVLYRPAAVSREVALAVVKREGQAATVKAG